MNEPHNACPVNETTGTIGPVEIARDALALLDAGKLLAEKSVYIAPENPWDHPYTGLYTDADQLERLVKGEERCRVCALGSLLVARICLDGPINLDYRAEHGLTQGVRESLLNYFPIEQLREIETAFEHAISFGGSYAAEQYGLKYEDPEDRLRAILNNIIDNGGTFRP